MQKIINIIFFSALLLCLGCKKYPPQNTSPVFQSYLKFKLNNVPIECTALIKATYFLPSITPDTAITITGSWADGDIALAVIKGQLLTPGTYTFTSSKLHSGTIWTKSPAGRYIAGADLFLGVYNGSGQITITEISTDYVKGNFDFITGVDITTNTFKTVTSGEFHIKRG
jgi:Family of unknown function (DUF6252)